MCVSNVPDSGERSADGRSCGGSFFLQAEDGIRDLVRSRGLGDVYKRQGEATAARNCHLAYFAEELARLAPRGREAGRPQYMLSLIHI